jgi:hypothetical protein
MNLRSLVVALSALALGVSGAVAAPPPGKGKPASAAKPEKTGKHSTTGATCRPKVTVVLKGTLTSTSTGALGMDVAHGNRWGRPYVKLGVATVVVDQLTKVRRNGEKLLTDLVVGDRLLVQARACKADLSQEAPPALTVVRVVAHPAKA